MIITWDNFDEFSAKFLENLPKASVITMDLEMTGINSDEKECLTDTPQEWYQKVY